MCATADELYRALSPRGTIKNTEHCDRFPGDVDQARAVARYLRVPPGDPADPVLSRLDSGLSLSTAQIIHGLRPWLTDEYQHDGLRTGNGAVLDHLLALVPEASADLLGSTCTASPAGCSTRRCHPSVTPVTPVRVRSRRRAGDTEARNGLYDHLKTGHGY